MFFDVNLSHRLAKMVEAMEEGARRIVHIRDHPVLRKNNVQYGNNTKDVEWISVLGKDAVDWVALSGDMNIIDTAHERSALKDAGLTFFAFDEYFANAGKHGQALQLIQMWPQIIEKVETCESGVFLIQPKKPAIMTVAEGLTIRNRKLKG